MARNRATGAWLMLGGPQKLPIQPDQWSTYDGEPGFLLSQAYQELLQAEAQGRAGDGKMLDLSMFTEPPLPYFVYKGRVVQVQNPLAPEELRGTRTVAGLPTELWDVPAQKTDMLPPAMRVGAVVSYFYQVHHDSVKDLEQLEAYLQDPTGQVKGPPTNPRRRVVILIQFPTALSDARRFAKKKGSASSVALPGEPELASVTVLEEDAKVPAVYEWWFGPAPAQSQVENPPVGRWKMYHPQVCRRLEELFQSNEGFRTGQVPVDVDGVRYMMQRITPDRPFDYCGKPSRETFLRDNIVTVNHVCYSDMDRASLNCFVQFQRGNPQRRRPARRRPDAAEIARSAVMTGSPCSICFSEEGQLTGCNRAHIICKGCLRAGLRAMAGDMLVVDNLLCGCFGRSTRRALLVLAEHADVSLQDMLASPPAQGSLEHQDFAAEVQQTMRQFDLGADPKNIPSNVYAQKIREWFTKVFMADVAHLYHPCSNPSCAAKMENWILIEDFERTHQAQGQSWWTCRDGHRNCVLPSEEEIMDMNKNLLLHPEYYTRAAAYDNLALRRYRLCAECVSGGLLMLAVHGGECKQWPGYGRGHQHVFCFACTRKWGETGCGHGRTDCRDPGVQQVRLLHDRLELGFVDADQYISWLKLESPHPPPTVYPSGAEDGQARQARLGLTDRARLLEESMRGTT